MNQELFDSMREQMTPSPEVRAALSEKLAQTPKKRPVPWKKYGALAACAALVIGGFSAYSLHQNPEAWTLITRNFHHDAQVRHLHSYVTVEGMAGYFTRDSLESSEDSGTGGTDGAGDQDMDMTLDDLERAMLDVGYTEGEFEEYQSIGYQMTWAKWWKFVGEQQNSEGDDPFNLDNLKTFSQKELSVHTGDLPGGAYVGDDPVQEALQAQANLSPYVRSMPDWFGGLYLDSSGTLVVCLVESEDPGDKSLELQVQKWADSDQVAFTDVKYSLAHLDALMDRLNHLPETDPECRGVMASWARDEMNNRVIVTLTEASDHMLSILAEMDPDDDAIYVQVGQWASAEDYSGGKEAPSVQYAVPGGTTVPDDEDLIADEPWYDGARYDVEGLPGKLPKEEKRPASTVDAVPEEDGCTLGYDPDVGFIYPNH